MCFGLLSFTCGQWTGRLGFTNLERAQAKIKGGPSLLFFGIGVVEVRGPELKTKGPKSFSFFLGKILHANFFFGPGPLGPHLGPSLCQALFPSLHEQNIIIKTPWSIMNHPLQLIVHGKLEL